MISDDLGYLMEYVDSINAWRKILKKDFLNINKDHEEIYDHIEKNIEGLADVDAEWDTGGRYAYLHTIKKEFHIWKFEKIREETKWE